MNNWLSNPPGYKVKSHNIYRIWNFSLSLLLIILTTPLFIGISIILLVTQGPKIFYSGVRYGKGKKTYQMYKFRTLNDSAATFTKNRLMTTRTNLETPMGKILRRSRLDELPQLFNVLRGDMNLVGPRPVRPEIYKILSKEIKNYSIRFQTKPGLVGVAQSLLPHSAPKILRHRLNRILLKKEINLLHEFLFLQRNALAILSTVFQIIIERFKTLMSGRITNCRSTERKCITNVYVTLNDENGILCAGSAIDINDESFAFHTTQTIENGNYNVYFELANNRKIYTQCSIIIQSNNEPQPGGNTSHKRRYTAFFRFQSALQAYRIEHHLLKNALIS